MESTTFRYSLLSTVQQLSWTVCSDNVNIFTRDDVVSQRLKFGSAFLSYSWESKIALFFNFPISRPRPEKIVWFLLAATSNHVQVRLDCTSRIKILRQQRREKWAYWFLDLRSRMSRIYYLQSCSLLGHFTARKECSAGYKKLSRWTSM